MNKRQLKKQMKKAQINIYDAYKNPVSASQKASALIVSSYKSASVEDRRKIMRAIYSLLDSVHNSNEGD